MTEHELKNLRRLVDQSLSAHTSLAQRLRRRQKLLTLAILVLSVLAGSMAFAGEEHRLDLGIAEASLPTWAGVLSALVFALALVDLVVAWGAGAGAHEEAARRLAILKGQFSGARVKDGIVNSGDLDLEAEYWSVMTSIAPIPNRHFVALKAEHLRKVEQSRTLDGAPAVPVWLLRAWLAGRGARRLRAASRQQGTPKPFLPDEPGNTPPGES